MIQLGLGLTIPLNDGFGNGGSSPPPYTTGAVGFDGATYLANAALVAADSPKYTLSAWVKTSVTGINYASTIAVVDPANQFNGAFLNDQPNTGQPYLFMENADGSYSIQTPGTGAGSAINDGDWHHLLWSVDASFSTQGAAVFYLDGVKFSADVGSGSNAGVTFSFNGLVMSVGWDMTTALGGYFNGDMADLQAFPGVSILDGAGTDISPADVALFIAGGKPVNPSVASTALGQPAVLLHIDAGGTPADFALNGGGSGGAFTITQVTTTAVDMSSLTSGQPTFTLTGNEAFEPPYDDPHNGLAISGAGVPSDTTIIDVTPNGAGPGYLAFDYTMSANASSDETNPTLAFGTGTLTLQTGPS